MMDVKKKKKERGMTAKAKKKTAKARSVVKRVDKGRVTINKRSIETLQPEMVRMLVKEPLELAPEAAARADIRITVTGGGFMGRALAARGAIAKSLVRMNRSEKLRRMFSEYDRMLIVDDPRRKESKKHLGRSARAKKQKSKR